MEEPFELRPGALVERCRVVQCLGYGRYGAVYEARESPHGARMAVYVLRRSLLAKADAAARFEHWVRSFAAVRHPHLAELRSVGSHEGVPCFIAELPDAETLHVKVARVGALPLSLAVDLVLPVVSVVAASHRAGVRMRVMPYGVFLPQPDGAAAVPRVVPFAVAEALAPGGGSGASASAEVLPFLSPEEARGSAALDVRSDVWSLGATLYAAATGRRPYHDEGAARQTLAAMISRAPKPPGEVRPGLPPAFDAVVMRALSLDPAARFATPEELGRALLPFASASARARWSADLGASLPPPDPSRRPTTNPPPAPAEPASRRPLAMTPASLTAEARRASLRRVPLFSALSAADADALLACMRWRSLAPGEALYREGDAGDTMAFVSSGTLSVHAARGEAEHEIARVGVGSLLGEMACLDPAPRSATVVAVDDVVVGELSRDGLDALTQHAPGIAAMLIGEVIRDVAVKVREVESRIDAVLAPPSRAPEAAAPEAGDAAQPVADEGPPRATSGVWRFVDFLRRIR